MCISICTYVCCMCTCRLDEMLLESRSVLEGLDVLMANVSLTRMHVHRYIYMLMLWANCVYIHNFVQPTFVEVVSESLIGEVKDAVTNMVCTCTCTCCTQSSFLTQHLSLSLSLSFLPFSLPPSLPTSFRVINLRRSLFSLVCSQ